MREAPHSWRVDPANNVSVYGLFMFVSAFAPGIVFTLTAA